MQKSSGVRNVMHSINVLDSKVISVVSDDHFDTIHLRIRASAVDYMVKLDSNVKIGSSSMGDFTEIYIASRWFNSISSSWLQGQNKFIIKTAKGDKSLFRT